MDIENGILIKDAKNVYMFIAFALEYKIIQHLIEEG